MKIHSYSLMRDVTAVQSRPRMPESLWQVCFDPNLPPLTPPSPTLGPYTPESCRPSSLPCIHLARHPSESVVVAVVNVLEYQQLSVVGTYSHTICSQQKLYHWLSFHSPTLWPCLQTAPLVVMNSFGGEEHLKLATALFQNLFPAINVHSTSLKACKVQPDTQAPPTPHLCPYYSSLKSISGTA